MTTEAQTYIEQLDSLRNEVRKTIQDMSTEGWNWTPLPADTNSLSVLAAHIAGSESFWVHQVVGGIDVHRDRDAEFAAAAASVAELEIRLDRVAQTTRSILQNLSSDDLSHTRVARPGEAPVSLRYSILHAISHLSQHVGHLTLTKQLYEASKG